MSELTQGRVAQYLNATADACECELCDDAVTAGTISKGECLCADHLCDCCGGDHSCKND